MAGEKDYSDGCCGDLCGQDSCRGNMCPAAVDAAIYDKWDVNDHGELPNDMWFLGFAPGSNCGYVPFRVTLETLQNKLTEWCFGDVKINAIGSSDFPCCNKCWALMNGRKINYYDKKGNLVECVTMCDMRGQVPVMADPTDYFGHGLTAVGQCTGEAKHTQQCEETRTCNIAEDFELRFGVPLRALNVTTCDNADEDNCETVIVWDENSPVIADNMNQDDYDIVYTTNNDDGNYTITQSTIKGAENATEPMNNIQPSKAVNYYMYICKPGLTATVDESSLPKTPACYEDYGVRNEAENNKYPWWVPQP